MWLGWLGYYVTTRVSWPCAEFQLLRLEAPSIRRESASFTKSSTHRYASEYQALAQALADPRCIRELWSPRIYLLNVSDDKPCAPRQYPGKSVGCVCNNTYCDEITRDKPTPNHFVAYTSSEVIWYIRAYNEMTANVDTQAVTPFSISCWNPKN